MIKSSLFLLFSIYQKWPKSLLFINMHFVYHFLILLVKCYVVLHTRIQNGTFCFCKMWLKSNFALCFNACFIYLYNFFSLTQTGSKAKSVLRPIILEDILKRHKERVHEVIEKESVGPTDHLKIYDKYHFLVSKQVK